MSLARLCQETDFCCTNLIQKNPTKLQLLFLETTVKACVYLQTPAPKILALFPEGLSLLSALPDPYHAECVGWRERDGACAGGLPRRN